MKREMLRFAIAGVIGLVVDACVLYGMLALGAGYFIGRAASFAAAVWSTWQFNRRFTFVQGSNKSAWAEWWHYLLAMVGGGVVNYAVYSAVVLVLPKSALLPLIGVALGSLAGMVVNFVSAKLWVFRARS